MASRRATVGCKIRAPAKLNLGLDLMGCRPDGFHELRTVMTTLRLSDEVHVIATPDESGLGLSAAGPLLGDDVPTDRSNLVIRALEALRNQTGCTEGGRVHLTKQIPSQAGLGGGSSDAAAALVAGNEVWRLGISIERLEEIGAKLGSDIPFFVRVIAEKHRGKRVTTALCSGRGERVVPISAHDGPPPGSIPVVVVKPREGLPTAAVYDECRANGYESRPRCIEQVTSCLGSGDRSGLGKALHNSLQAPALRIASGLVRVRQWFERRQTLGHQLSGSGTAYFALCGTVFEARRVAAAARAAGLGRAWATSTG